MNDEELRWYHNVMIVFLLYLIIVGFTGLYVGLMSHSATSQAYAKYDRCTLEYRLEGVSVNSTRDYNQCLREVNRKLKNDNKMIEDYLEAVTFSLYDSSRDNITSDVTINQIPNG